MEHRSEFSSCQISYYNAWKYVTKADKNSVQSNDHLDLNASTAPRTCAASYTNCKDSTSKNAPEPKKVNQITLL